MLFMSLYLGLVYISKAVENFYPYLWLDPKVGWKQIVAHVIGYTMAIILFYNVVLGLIWLRRSHTEPTHENHSDDEVTLRPRDLEMAGNKSDWNFSRPQTSRPQTSVSLPETAYTRHSTFNFAFDEVDRYSQAPSSPRTPDSPRLRRDERGFWTLAHNDKAARVLGG